MPDTSPAKIIETANQYYIVPLGYNARTKDFNKIYIKTSSGCNLSNCRFCPSGHCIQSNRHSSDLTKHRFYYDLSEIHNYDIIQYHYGRIYSDDVGALVQFGVNKLSTCAYNGENFWEVHRIDDYSPLESIEFFIPPLRFPPEQTHHDSELNYRYMGISPFSNQYTQVVDYINSNNCYKEIVVYGFNSKGGNFINLMRYHEEMRQAVKDNQKNIIDIMRRCVHKEIHFIIDKDLAEYYGIPSLFMPFQPDKVKSHNVYIDISNNKYSGIDFSANDSKEINLLSTKEMVADIERRF